MIKASNNPSDCSPVILETPTSIQKTVLGNVTIDDSYNGSIVKIKSNCIITIPLGLLVNFNCVFRTFTGVTATFAGVDVTWDAPKGKILEEFKMATLFKDGAAEIIILEGELKL